MHFDTKRSFDVNFIGDQLGASFCGRHLFLERFYLNYNEGMQHMCFYSEVLCGCRIPQTISKTYKYISSGNAWNQSCSEML